MEKTITGWVAVNRNRKVGEFRKNEVEALADSLAYNESPGHEHPDEQSRVLHVEDYVAQLEAAIVSIEYQYAAQKAHMKQLWKDERPV